MHLSNSSSSCNFPAWLLLFIIIALYLYWQCGWLMTCPQAEWQWGKILTIKWARSTRFCIIYVEEGTFTCVESVLCYFRKSTAMRNENLMWFITRIALYRMILVMNESLNFCCRQRDIKICHNTQGEYLVEVDFAGYFLFLSQLLTKKIVAVYVCDEKSFR